MTFRSVVAVSVLFCGCLGEPGRPVAPTYVDQLGRECQKVGFDGHVETTVCRDKNSFDVKVEAGSTNYVLLRVRPEERLKLEDVFEADLDGVHNGLALSVDSRGDATLERHCRDGTCAPNAGRVTCLPASTPGAK